MIEQADSGCTKIGISYRPYSRIQSFQTGNPDPLVLRFIVSCNGDVASLESRLHSKFARVRVQGEWFRVLAADVAESLQTDFLAFPDIVTVREVEPPYKRKDVEGKPRELSSRLIPQAGFYMSLVFWILMRYVIFQIARQHGALTSLEAFEFMLMEAGVGAYFAIALGDWMVEISHEWVAKQRAADVRNEFVASRNGHEE